MVVAAFGGQVSDHKYLLRNGDKSAHLKGLPDTKKNLEY